MEHCTFGPVKCIEHRIVIDSDYLVRYNPSYILDRILIVLNPTSNRTIDDIPQVDLRSKVSFFQCGLPSIARLYCRVISSGMPDIS